MKPTQINDFTVFGESEKISPSGTKMKYLKCRCKCGKELSVQKSMVLKGVQKSCGRNECHPSVRKHLGTKINKLTLISYDSKTSRYRCQCECGNFTIAKLHQMKIGDHKTCGCLFNSEESKRKRDGRLPDNLAVKRDILRDYKNNAKRRGHCFELSEEKFFDLIVSPCRYCKTVGYSECKAQRKFFLDVPFKYNGVDRMDNSMGYTEDNCVTCCGRCNLAKHAMSFSDWKEWTRKISENIDSW